MCAPCYAAINRARKRRWRERTGRTPATVPNLQAIRRALGIGFKEFARLAGISESHLANLEAGKRRASRKMQRRLVAAVAKLRVKHPERWEQVKRWPANAQARAALRRAPLPPPQNSAARAPLEKWPLNGRQ